MRTLLNELRYAARRLAQSRVLAIAAIGTLALTIGAAVAAWGVVYRVVLNPLPYSEPNRLVWLDHAAPGIGATRGLDLSQGLVRHYRASSRSFSTIAAFVSVDENVSTGSDPERLEVTSATANLAATLGVPPVLGRFFSAEEDQPGGAPVAVLSEGFWLRRFGGDADAVGRSVDINGVAHRIIGIMPDRFDFPSPETAVWVPIALDPASTVFGGFSLHAIARLSNGVSVQAAQQELTSILPRVTEIMPGAAGLLRETRLQPLVDSLQAHLVGDVQRILWIVLGAVAFVLLTAAANLTGLFMVRAEARQREVAVRQALGARRAVLLRYFLAESGLVAIAGGALGVALGAWGLAILRTSGSANLPRRDEIGLDAMILVAAGVVTVIVAIVLALPPILQRVGLASVLREAGRGLTSGRQRATTRRALVSAQVALAVMLMVGAALMVRTFEVVTHRDTGFTADHVLTFELGLSRNTYETRERAILAQQAILARVRALPGVEGVGMTTCLPLCGRWAGDGWRAEDRPLAPNEPPPVGATRMVSARYLEALRVPVVAGRHLTTADESSPAAVVVISAQLAHRLWPGASAVGRRVTNESGADAHWFTVVGVVGNTPIRTTTEDPAPMVYFPLRTGVTAPSPWQGAFAVRTSGPSDRVGAAIRREVAAVDPTVAVARLQGLEEIVGASNARLALVTTLLGGAALVALLLGVIGIYGVVAFVVGRRLPEFGLRLALGASGSDIVRLLLRQGGIMVGAGLVAGLAGALALTRLMGALLVGVSARDPLAFGGAAMTLALVALAAVYIPSRRAARADPSALLRSD